MDIDVGVVRYICVSCYIRIQYYCVPDEMITSQ